MLRVGLGDFISQAAFTIDPRTMTSTALPSAVPIPNPTGINPNAPAGPQLTIGGAAAPWYKTWWGMLGIGALGFLAYKRYVAK